MQQGKKKKRSVKVLKVNLEGSVKENLEVEDKLEGDIAGELTGASAYYRIISSLVWNVVKW